MSKDDLLPHTKKLKYVYGPKQIQRCKGTNFEYFIPKTLLKKNESAKPNPHSTLRDLKLKNKDLQYLFNGKPANPITGELEKIQENFSQFNQKQHLFEQWCKEQLTNHSVKSIDPILLKAYMGEANQEGYTHCGSNFFSSKLWTQHGLQMITNSTNLNQTESSDDSTPLKSEYHTVDLQSPTKFVHTFAIELKNTILQTSEFNERYNQKNSITIPPRKTRIKHVTTLEAKSNSTYTVDINQFEFLTEDELVFRAGLPEDTKRDHIALSIQTLINNALEKIIQNPHYKNVTTQDLEQFKSMLSNGEFEKTIAHNYFCNIQKASHIDENAYPFYALCVLIESMSPLLNWVRQAPTESKLNKRFIKLQKKVYNQIQFARNLIPAENQLSPLFDNFIEEIESAFDTACYALTHLLPGEKHYFEVITNLQKNIYSENLLSSLENKKELNTLLNDNLISKQYELLNSNTDFNYPKKIHDQLLSKTLSDKAILHVLIKEPMNPAYEAYSTIFENIIQKQNARTGQHAILSSVFILFNNFFNIQKQIERLSPITDTEDNLITELTNIEQKLGLLLDEDLDKSDDSYLLNPAYTQAKCLVNEACVKLITPIHQYVYTNSLKPFIDSITTDKKIKNKKLLKRYHNDFNNIIKSFEQGKFSPEQLYAELNFFVENNKAQFGFLSFFNPINWFNGNIEKFKYTQHLQNQLCVFQNRYQTYTNQLTENEKYKKMYFKKIRKEMDLLKNKITRDSKNPKEKNKIISFSKLENLKFWKELDKLDPSKEEKENLVKEIPSHYLTLQCLQRKR